MAKKQIFYVFIECDVYKFTAHAIHILSIAKTNKKITWKKYSEQLNKLMLICFSLESLILQT